MKIRHLSIKFYYDSNFNEGSRFDLPRIAKLCQVMALTLVTTSMIAMPANAVTQSQVKKTSTKTKATTKAKPTKPSEVTSPDPLSIPPSELPVLKTPPNPELIDLTQVEVSPNAQVIRYDPIINNGVPFPPTYEVSMPSYLTLSQAQDYLVKVSPKVAADNAAIVSNEKRAEATKSLNKPIVYIGATTAHVHFDENLNTDRLKDGLSDGINQAVIDTLPNLPISLPPTPTPIDVGGFLTDPIPSNYPLNLDKNVANANVTVLWSAYNGHKTESLTNLLNGMTDESRADANLSLDEQYTTLTKRYFQTQLAIMAAFLRNDALAAIQQTDHTAQRALDVGLISQVERLEAKKALADAEYENIKALNDAELAMTSLQRLLRTPYAIKPTSPLFVSTKPLPSLAYFQDQAKQHHPAFQKVAAKYSQAKALHEFSESNYKPTVTVFGRTQIESEPNWMAGVSANWKLWGGIDREASTQSSLAKLHQAEFSQVDVTDNIMLLVEKNWQTLKNAQQNYLALNTNIELAKEMLRFRQLGFKEGVNTAVEVIQAEANVEKAKTEQAKAANDYVQALADLMQSCGTPLEFNTYMQAADIKLPAIYFEHKQN